MFTIGIAAILLVGCTQPEIKKNEINQDLIPSIPSDSTSKDTSPNNVVLEHEKNKDWLQSLKIEEIEVGDIKYGMQITSINAPEIHLKGPAIIKGTLEWEIFYDLATLVFKPDIPTEEKITFGSDKRSIERFLVEETSLLPVRQGAKVEAAVESMQIVIMESSKPSLINISNIKIIGNTYETISETSPEWLYNLKLEKDAIDATTY